MKPLQLLEDLALEFDVNSTTYKEFNETKKFSDGFYDRFYEFIDKDYLDKVLVYME